MSASNSAGGQPPPISGGERPAALYVPEGDLLVPTSLTAGPWSADAQHGGPVSALLARAVESATVENWRGPAARSGGAGGEAVGATGHAGAAPMQVVRLTIELLRPVPLSPLAVTSRITRPGKRVQLVEASLLSGDTEVATARALRIRVASVSVPTQEPWPPSPDLPLGPRSDMSGPQRTAYAGAVDLRFVQGGWDSLGPVTMWSRLEVPVVHGEEPSPLQRTAAAADFGNGVSRILDFDTHTFINPDLTVALSRVPQGEWIGFDVVSRLSPDGWGQAEALIFDSAGPVGRSVQSVLLEER